MTKAFLVKSKKSKKYLEKIFKEHNINLSINQRSVYVTEYGDVDYMWYGDRIDTAVTFSPDGIVYFSRGWNTLGIEDNGIVADEEHLIDLLRNHVKDNELNG